MEAGAFGLLDAAVATGTASMLAVVLGLHFSSCLIAISGQPPQGSMRADSAAPPHPSSPASEPARGRYSLLIKLK